VGGSGAARGGDQSVRCGVGVPRASGSRRSTKGLGRRVSTAAPTQVGAGQADACG